MSRRAQVIVVGAGPVGTVAAYFLATKGIDVVLLESASSCEADMRASTLHAPTIDMLDQLGVAQALIDDGLKAPVYQYRIRANDETLEFDLSELGDELRFPFRLQCEQYKLARLLAQELEDHPNATVHFNTCVESFIHQDEHVTLSAITPDGVVQYTAEYVIAADGANSTIRKQLGVGFSGFTYPEKFLTLSTSTEMSDYLEGISYVNYVSDPGEWYVLLRVPSAWRILVPADGEQTDEYILSETNKDRILEGLIGSSKDISTHHRTIYRVHQRVATRFDHGRIMLVGDAAHLNNPLGGFGMNSGIHDAWNLCSKLVDIFSQGIDSKKALGQFDRQRRTVMNDFIQTQTIRNKQMMEEGPEKGQQREWEEMRRINDDTELRRNFMRRQSMVLSLSDEANIA